MSGSRLRWATLAGVLPAAMLLAAIPSETGVARVSGKLTMKYSQQHPLPVSDAAGPVLLANEAKGTNRNTGPTEYMSGATVTIVEIADLTQGNGPHQGYVTFAKGRDTTVNRFTGRITTVLSAEKQPITTFEGVWTKMGGAGQYEGILGKGRYRGRMLSPTEYVVDWDGDVQLKNQAANQ